MAQARWIESEDSFGNPMHVLTLDGEEVAEIRPSHPYAAFRMQHYRCKRCGDNLASAVTLNTMKSHARQHQTMKHGG